MRYLLWDGVQIEEGGNGGTVQEGLTFAANAAKVTDRTTDTEDRKHTSGGVFVAVDSNW